MLPWHCLARVNSPSHDDDDVADELWCRWQEAGFLAWKSLERSDLLSNDSDTLTSHRCVAQLIYMHPGWEGDTGSGRTREAASTRCSTSCWPCIMAAQQKPNHQDMQQQMDGTHVKQTLQSHHTILSTNIWLRYGGKSRNFLYTIHNCLSQDTTVYKQSLWSWLSFTHF